MVSETRQKIIEVYYSVQLKIFLIFEKKLKLLEIISNSIATIQNAQKTKAV